jgi:hypothetical protein
MYELDYWHDVRTKFNQNLSVGSNLVGWGRGVDTLISPNHTPNHVRLVTIFV